MDRPYDLKPHHAVSGILHHYRLILGLLLALALTAVLLEVLFWHRTLPIRSSGRLNLTVRDEWVGDSEPTKDVQVKLYARGSRYFYNETTGTDFYEEGTFLVDTVELNEANNWTYTWVDQPMKVKQILKYGTYVYTYDDFYIREAYPYAMDYDITYEDENGNSMVPTSLKVNHQLDFPKWWDPYESGTVNVVPACDGTIVIQNQQSYAITRTGVSIIRWFIIGGAALLLMDGAVHIYKRRKYKIGGRLDEKNL